MSMFLVMALLACGGEKGTGGRQDASLDSGDVEGGGGAAAAPEPFSVTCNTDVVEYVTIADAQQMATAYPVVMACAEHGQCRMEELFILDGYDGGQDMPAGVDDTTGIWALCSSNELVVRWVMYAG